MLSQCNLACPGANYHINLRTASLNPGSPESTMTILVTGGTGKIGSKLAHLLDSAKVPFVLASRSGSAPVPFEGVKFDWFDESTYRNAFDAHADIDKVFLIPPALIDPTPIAKSFIDFAISKGVKRFVLISISTVEKGGDGNGKVHEYLVESGADYIVLRPTWFIGAHSISLFIFIRI